MRVPRIHVDALLREGAEFELPAAQARHVGQVLRLAPNAPLVLFNGDGHAYQARLIASTRETTRVLVETRGEAESAPPLEIHLALGVSKGERMDFALQKAVELGVTRLTPLFTKRGQVKLDGARLEKRLEHWRGVIIAACEQSGRQRIPRLEAAPRLDDWLGMPRAGGLLLDPQAEQALTSRPAPEAGGVTLLIGPEGGLDSGEREAALRQGFVGVRLGPRILRTETAPLAAIAVIQALWGDFGDARSG
ncbi:16S rRNA (uracil(1498)-N(3))-methyltransferase [Thiocystis violacea]|uniref:16S rRNA (uracil(1498)-N(3))-methyltransferase n=1 Tax=Thiocystis violacea TaxID=13725 RepID=UPI001906678C|nr:16S rRNA (uracil(1498)-N(3))-methyltransferase [Thiocystis violacea]